MVSECQVLRDGFVVAPPIRDIKTHQVVRVEEEHVHVLLQALESRGVIWEPVARIGRGGLETIASASRSILAILL